MRHLKKFNESTEEGLDIEYIKFCFIDMVEVEADKEIGEITYWNKVSDIGAMNQIEDRATTSENVTNVIIFVMCPQLNIEHTPDGFKGSISQFVEYNKAFAVFLCYNLLLNPDFLIYRDKMNHDQQCRVIPLGN